MNVLVTGAGGFIGSAVVRALSADGHAPRAHLGAPGDPVAQPAPGIETVLFEITDAAALERAMQGIDAVVHLAGPAAVAPSFADPIGYARAHTIGTATVVAAMEAAKVPTLVYVSSAEIYGRPDCDPVDESARFAPRSPYGAAKAAAETIVASAARRNAFASTVILRPFSVYGPGQRPNSLLSAVLRQAKFAEEIALDDLRPERDYVYVDDVAAAILAALEARITGVTIANVASGTAISVGDLARTAAKASGRIIPVRERGATRPAGAEIMRLVADVSRAEEALGWRARVELTEGLRRTLAHVTEP